MPIMVWDRRHVGNVDYGRLNFFGGLRVGFWKMKGNPLTDQLVAFAGRLQETLFGQHHDLSLTGDNQARTFQTLAMRSMIFASSSFAVSAERMVVFLNLRGTSNLP